MILGNGLRVLGGIASTRLRFEETVVIANFADLIEMQLTDNGLRRKGFADPRHFGSSPV
jgi:hypothetical protein